MQIDNNRGSDAWYGKPQKKEWSYSQ
jgi:hypothetical protein